MGILVYKLPLLAVTLLAALFLERLAAGFAAGRFFVPPLLSLAVLGWLVAFSLPGRLWLGGSAGFFIDTAGPAPFGTNILLGLMLAIFAQILDSVIAHRDSFLAKGAVFAALASAAFLLTPAARQLMGYLKAVGV